MVTLIVWQKQGNGKVRKLTYPDIPSHQEASKLARNAFAGMRTKIIDKGRRHFKQGMKSYCDMMRDRLYWA